MDVKQALERGFRDAPFIAHLGIALEGLGAGWCEASLDLEPWHLQQNGIVHAGVIATLADHCAGAAATTQLREGEYVVSVEFRIHLLRPATGERLHCRGQVLKPNQPVRHHRIRGLGQRRGPARPGRQAECDDGRAAHRWLRQRGAGRLRGHSTRDHSVRSDPPAPARHTARHGIEVRARPAAPRIPHHAVHGGHLLHGSRPRARAGRGDLRRMPRVPGLRRAPRKCPYGPAKPTCARCPIHCYKPAPRETARVVAASREAHDAAPVAQPDACAGQGAARRASDGRPPPRAQRLLIECPPQPRSSSVFSFSWPIASGLRPPVRPVRSRPGARAIPRE